MALPPIHRLGKTEERIFYELAKYTRYTFPIITPVPADELVTKLFPKRLPPIPKIPSAYWYARRDRRREELEDIERYRRRPLSDRQANELQKLREDLARRGLPRPILKAYSPVLQKTMSKWSFDAQMRSLRARGFVKFVRQRLLSAGPLHYPKAGRTLEEKERIIMPLVLQQRQTRRYAPSSETQIVGIMGYGKRAHPLLYVLTQEGLRYAEVLWRLPYSELFR